MATVNEVLRGLEILAKYRGDEHEVAAEHDILYSCHVDHAPLTDEEKQEMEKLGWHIDSEFDCWACFV